MTDVTRTSKEQLRPCHWCGSKDVRLHVSDGKEYAQCHDCTACGPDHINGRHWNTLNCICRAHPIDGYWLRINCPVHGNRWDREQLDKLSSAHEPCVCQHCFAVHKTPGTECSVEDCPCGYYRASQPPSPEWQPIETAPKDGTEIALLFPREDSFLGRTLPKVRAASWYRGAWSIPHFTGNMPTHWQFLPAAPCSETTKESAP